MKWSKEEIGILKRLWNNPKVTVEDLVKVLGRDWNSIEGKRKYLGLLPRSDIVERNINRDYLKRLLETVEG